ncbi:MAG: S41 family peptidase, partial [Porticoccaceae bacterium]|nr:S41 family peptidase [Porticoccaceae bacterium]
TVLPLREDKAIKLTTARYFTPSGNSIQAQGITPDILVEPAEIKLLEQKVGISEANLARHLENGKKTAGKPPAREKKPSTVEDDNQLYEALNILKGIAIFRQ